MNEFEDQSLKAFLDALASGSPTPGGGGAAALMGAQAAALVSMVCNLTIGKPKYAEAEALMHSILENAEALRDKFTVMMAQDVAVFNQVMTAYGLPKESDAEKTVRSAEIQVALKSATEVPLACAIACAEVIALSKRVAEHGNLNVISDAGVAAMAGYGALKSAALNVYVNTGSLKDRGFAEACLAELETVLNTSGELAEAVYQLVKSKL